MSEDQFNQLLLSRLQYQDEILDELNKIAIQYNYQIIDIRDSIERLKQNVNELVSLRKSQLIIRKEIE